MSVGGRPGRSSAVSLGRKLNMLRVAKVITQGALEQKESRGGHNRDDFKETKEDFRKHTVASIDDNGKVKLGYKPVCV
jgi:succinate dehydrogenase / fumarate reductase flavoprotein subunit